MSASPARIQANRRNAESSTGPRTADGKLQSSMNALRHGLTSKMILLPEEDLKTYQDFRDRFFGDLQPKGFLEEQLALTLVNTQWRLNRCRAFEQSILTHQPGGKDLTREQVESLSKLSLYEQRLSRTFHTTLKQFLQLRAERKQQEQYEMKDAAKVLKLCRAKQMPYDPAASGFVFSSADVETWLRRHDQVEEARRADMIEFNQRFFGPLNKPNGAPAFY